MSRFLTLAQVADELDIPVSAARALVRSGDLPAIKIGGRGFWRVERSQLEEWLQQRHGETRAFIEQHPFPHGLPCGDDCEDARPERT